MGVPMYFVPRTRFSTDKIFVNFGLLLPWSPSKREGKSIAGVTAWSGGSAINQDDIPPLVSPRPFVSMYYLQSAATIQHVCDPLECGLPSWLGGKQAAKLKISISLVAPT